jgi:hypothetical protein
VPKRAPPSRTARRTPHDAAAPTTPPHPSSGRDHPRGPSASASIGHGETAKARAAFARSALRRARHRRADDDVAAPSPRLRLTGGRGGVAQRDQIHGLQARTRAAEGRIAELRRALAAAQLDLQAAEQIMEAYSFIDSEYSSFAAADLRFLRVPSAVAIGAGGSREPGEEVFRAVMDRLESAEAAIQVAAGPGRAPRVTRTFRES